MPAVASGHELLHNWQDCDNCLEALQPPVHSRGAGRLIFTSDVRFMYSLVTATAEDVLNRQKGFEALLQRAMRRQEAGWSGTLRLAIDSLCRSCTLQQLCVVSSCTFHVTVLSPGRSARAAAELLHLALEEEACSKAEAGLIWVAI